MAGPSSGAGLSRLRRVRRGSLRDLIPAVHAFVSAGRGGAQRGADQVPKGPAPRGATPRGLARTRGCMGGAVPMCGCLDDGTNGVASKCDQHTSREGVRLVDECHQPETRRLAVQQVDVSPDESTARQVEVLEVVK